VGGETAMGKNQNEVIWNKFNEKAFVETYHQENEQRESDSKIL
jgi:hypothetical protein